MPNKTCQNPESLTNYRHPLLSLLPHLFQRLTFPPRRRRQFHPIQLLILLPPNGSLTSRHLPPLSHLIEQLHALISTELILMEIVRFCYPKSDRLNRKPLSGEERA